jgi:succinate dehydrogenase/fumarate reductase flavoprotein subunit
VKSRSGYHYIPRYASRGMYSEKAHRSRIPVNGKNAGAQDAQQQELLLTPAAQPFYKTLQTTTKGFTMENVDTSRRGEVAGGVHGASRLGTVAVIDALTFGMIAGEQFAKMKA